MSRILILVGSVRRGGNTDLFDTIKTQYHLALNFFHLEDADMLLARGVKDIGDIQATDALEQAYRLGQSIK
ncbi:MAG: hypothetical protein IJ580_10270 [Prevotella sp.]|nr:hypothetical protein [Prevotella sp.]